MYVYSKNHNQEVKIEPKNLEAVKSALDDQYSAFDITHLRVNTSILYDFITIYSITTFICERCENLISVTYFPNLERLTISSCPQIKSLPYFSKLRYLSLVDSEIPNIPYYSDLESISIRNCSNLSELLNFPTLKSLSISSCPKIKSLPNCRDLNYLSLMDCDIINIPDYQKLEFFYFHSDHVLPYIHTYKMKPYLWYQYKVHKTFRGVEICFPRFKRLESIYSIQEYIKLASPYFNLFVMLRVLPYDLTRMLKKYIVQ